MTIQERIQAIQKIIDDQRSATGGHSEKAVELQKKAAAAILGTEAEIKTYMEIFCFDPNNPNAPADAEALAKLTPNPAEPSETGKNLARAYLMGNGNCGPASPAGADLGLLFTVGSTLDE